MRRFIELTWLVMVAGLSCPSLVLAEGDDTAIVPATTAAMAPAEMATDAATQPDTADDLRARTERLEALVTSQQQRIDELQNQVTFASEQGGGAAFDAEDAGPEGGSALGRLLNIYGFFDLGLFHTFVDDSNPTKGLTNVDLTFTQTNLNLYLASQMSEDWNALVELRFTFLPRGEEVYFPAEGVAFKREDTSVRDAISNEEIELGGVAIERAQVTWSPRDYFRITAGRFLTPYGIWNVEHGSPVLIPMFPPVMQYRHLVPAAQTGLMLHGQLIPHSGLYFDYALTVSNGRGPADALYDLDRNKALGLRLKLTHETQGVRWHFGGYGYYGEYTDNTKEIIPAFPFDVRTTIKERYHELSGTLDFLFETHGVRVQAEYVRRLVSYDMAPQRVAPIVNQVIGAERQPDYVSWDLYGLLAYTLPLERLLGEATLTPFVVAEYSMLDDTNPNYDTLSILGGLNFKPKSFVVLKAVVSRVTALDSIYITSPFWSVCGQIAVMF